MIMRKQMVLLDEDKDDWMLVQDSIKELGLDVSIQFISNSEELFHYLREGNRPAFILVDFNALPDNGLEVLKKLKSNINWKEIPVCILSENREEKYKQECYRLGASAFILKPSTHAETLTKIETFFRYWTDVVEA